MIVLIAMTCGCSHFLLLLAMLHVHAWLCSKKGHWICWFASDKWPAEVVFSNMWEWKKNHPLSVMGIYHRIYYLQGFPGSTSVKELSTKAGDTKYTGSIHGLGRSPGGGHGHPLQYSYLQNPVDRGVWRAAVRRVTKSLTLLKGLSTHVHILLTFLI